jgi:LAO/AO transport system kinase
LRASTETTARDLAERALDGAKRALARLISYIEDGRPEAGEILSILYPHTGQAHVVGITGAPGTGKSTLVNEICKLYRQGVSGCPPLTVGVVAVDATSPFSGGALLGDRLRMCDLAGDPGVFVRSMASRGSLGGLAQATANVVLALDAAGYRRIIVETVGAGQVEVDIAHTAHTTVVVEAPGLGDEVQAIKAGILEIADLFAVNKADREGADRTAAALEMMVNMERPARPIFHHGTFMATEAAGLQGEREGSFTWHPPVLKTIALSGVGVRDLVEKIEAHRAYLHESGEIVRKELMRAIAGLENILQQNLLRRLFASLGGEAWWRTVERVVQRQADPYSAVQELLQHIDVYKR